MAPCVTSVDGIPFAYCTDLALGELRYCLGMKSGFSSEPSC